MVNAEKNEKMFYYLQLTLRIELTFQLSLLKLHFHFQFASYLSLHLSSQAL